MIAHESVWRANVAAETVSVERLPERWRKQGGRALIPRILLDEIPPGFDPLGPLNKLIWSVGLLVGHGISSCDRISIGAKSPLTGGVKESNGGGSTGLRLSRLGIRALILEGAPSDAGWRLLCLSTEGGVFEPADELEGSEEVEAIDGAAAEDEAPEEAAAHDADPHRIQPMMHHLVDRVQTLVGDGRSHRKLRDYAAVVIEAAGLVADTHRAAMQHQHAAAGDDGEAEAEDADAEGGGDAGEEEEEDADAEGGEEEEWGGHDGVQPVEEYEEPVPSRTRDVPPHQPGGPPPPELAAAGDDDDSAVTQACTEEAEAEDDDFDQWGGWTGYGEAPAAAGEGEGDDAAVTEDAGWRGRHGASPLASRFFGPAHARGRGRGRAPKPKKPARGSRQRRRW